MPYLQNRECQLGGYATKFTTFYPLIGKPINVLLYIATPQNPLWMGEDNLTEMATQITSTKGPNGHNVEYLLRLAEFMRRHCPGEEDYHLFALEKEVLQLIERQNMCLKTLMGDGQECIQFVKQYLPINNSTEPVNEPQERTDSFQYTSRVPGTKLRCLNI